MILLLATTVYNCANQNPPFLPPKEELITFGIQSERKSPSSSTENTNPIYDAEFSPSLIRGRLDW